MKFDITCNKILEEIREYKLGGFESYTGKAKAYVNLHASQPKEGKIIYSIQGVVTDPSGKKAERVIGYGDKLVLKDVAFNISPSGWKKVQDEGGKKNVHAKIIGYISNEEPQILSTKITYNPRVFRYFVRLDSNNKPVAAVKGAKKVSFFPNGLFADGVIDIPEGEIRPEGIYLTKDELDYMAGQKEKIKNDRQMNKTKI